MMRKKNKILTVLMVFFTVLLMVSGSAGASEADRMPQLEEGRLCTLKIAMTYTDPNLEEDNVKVMPGTEVLLAKVADLTVNGGSAEYTLLEDYAETGISFAGMTASDSNAAAAVLAPLVRESEIRRAEAGGDGTAEFTDLEPGMYLLYQKTDANEAYHVNAMSAMLLAVPLPVIAQEGNSWQYDISIRPKTELTGPHKNGRIKVTKQLIHKETGLEISVPGNAELVFYVGLFADEACTERVRGTADQELRFKDSGSAGTVFENLMTDQTYYIAETDGKGKVITEAEKNGATFTAEYPDGQSVTITQQNPEREIRFRNTTPDFPVWGYYAGKLTITKKTVKNGRNYPVTQTFYAGIFSDREHKNRIHDVVELKLENAYTVSITLRVDIGDSETTKAVYYVAETDRDGRPLENGRDLGFTISTSPEDGKVTLMPTASDGEVIITNEFPPDETTPPGSDTPPGGDSTPPNGNPPKTGDETPIAFYAGLLLAMIFLIAVLGRKRKIRK